MNPLVALLIGQTIFTGKDLLARTLVKNHNFGLGTLHKPLFWLVIFMHIAGFMFELYVLSNFTLGRTMVALSMLSVTLSVVLGWLVLGESISLLMYLSVILAFCTFLVVAYAVQ
jgi:uncharacterized membrane protein